MSDNPHGPREGFRVIDGPLQGELRAPRETDAKELTYVRYWLREGADGRLVWSCAPPAGTVTRNA